MNDELTQKLNRQFEQAFAPARQFASVSVEHAHKVANFQFEAGKSYVDFGIEQARGALQVNDVRSLQDFLSKQQEAASSLSRKIGDDLETLMSYGKDYTEAATKAAKDNADSAAETASNKARKSA